MVLVVKNLPASVEDIHPWVGKILWRREWQLTPVLLSGEFHGQRSLASYSPWGCKELDVIERLTRIHTQYIVFEMHFPIQFPLKATTKRKVT